MYKSKYLPLFFSIFAITILASCSNSTDAEEPEIDSSETEISSSDEDISSSEEISSSSEESSSSEPEAIKIDYFKDNHARVFVQQEAFQDPGIFADSMITAEAFTPDSVADTLTLTINDTVYFMGVIPQVYDSVFKYQWVLQLDSGKDTTFAADNADPIGWAFSKAGIYNPLFIVTADSSTDSSGTITKNIFINVIDTKPVLSVPEDTLKTRNKGDIKFAIFAKDSLGTIEKVLIDLDASGEEDAKEWKYDVGESEDSLYVTIENNDKYIDEYGNQKIYVTVVDEDNNETTDSVNLHFNRLPKLSVIYPLDLESPNIADEFHFEYKATDEDNPENLRYTIYVLQGESDLPPSREFNSTDIIASDIAQTKYVPTTKLSGPYHWQMFVTDGYDTVYTDCIPDGDDFCRPWYFNIEEKPATISGVVTYQGKATHEGIHVELDNGEKKYETVTDANGNYTFTAMPGTYSITAKSDNKEYENGNLEKLVIGSGAQFAASALELKDVVPPQITAKKSDTLSVRNQIVKFAAYDFGSFVQSVDISLDGGNLPANCDSNDEGTGKQCTAYITSLTNGIHNLVFSATDNAGNMAEVKRELFVDATTLTLEVNEAQKDVIGSSDTLRFVANLIGAFPAAQFITWSYRIENDTVTKQIPLNDNGQSFFPLSFNELKNAFDTKSYTMTASYTENGLNLSAQVKFGIRGSKPGIYIKKPGLSKYVTINDQIEFQANFFQGVTSTKLMVKWDCGNNLSTTTVCPDQIQNTEITDSTKVSLAFSTPGEHKVIANAIDDKGTKASDSIIVHVIQDPPKVSAYIDEIRQEYKVNTTVPVVLDGHDNYGYIKSIQWGCGTGIDIPFNNEHIFTDYDAFVNDFKINIALPSKATDDYRCIFKAIDDDDEEGLDTLIFKVTE